MERDKSLDIAKGFLILLVVIHHMPVFTMMGIKDENAEWLGNTEFLYKSFFMPAFFVITGICSNFNKAFLKYCTDIFKGILFPALIFQILCPYILLLNYHNWAVDVYVDYAKNSILSTLIEGTRYWFLNALIIAKIIYWFIYRIKNEYLKLFICIVFLFIGIIGNHMISVPWHIWHACSLLIFLWMGNNINKFNFSSKVQVAFVVCYALSLLFIKNIPSLTQTYQIELSNSYLFLFLSVSGTMMLLSLSRLLNNNKILEFYGKNSLLIYCVHIELLQIIFLHSKSLFNHGAILTTLALLSIFIITCILLYGIIKIINSPKLSWMLGKF